AKQGLHAWEEPNSYGKHEIEAKALWKLEMKDEIEDQKPELVRFGFGGVESFDLNESGTVEYERFLGAQFNVTDANSDGFAEEVEAGVLFYHTYDSGDDGSREYQGLASIHLKTVDSNSDGDSDGAAGQCLGPQPEVNTSVAGVRACADMRCDRGVAGPSLGAPSDGIHEKESLFAARATIENAIEDDQPEHALMEAIAYEREDPNQDGVYEEQRAAALRFEANDTNSNGHFEIVSAQAWAAHVTDANSDRAPEHEGAIHARYLAPDAR